MGWLKDRWKRIAFFFAILGPGIITATVDNDAGGITTYSVAGAHFGYAILWTLIPITIVLIIVQEMAARMGAVTGQGLADLIRENFGIKLTFFIMVGLIIANVATTIAEFAGIAAATELFGLSKYIVIPFCALAVWLLVTKASYRTVEKAFLIMTVFYVAYIVSGIMAKPDWGEVFHGLLVPTFAFSAPYILIVIGLIGTTITPWMQFYLQSSIVEKGIKEEEYKYSKWDVILGCITTDVVSFFIIVATAATLFMGGISINSAQDAAIALRPFAGQFAMVLFAAGLFAAGLFGAAILPLSTSFYICEGLGWESGVNKKFKDAPQFYLLFSVIILIGAAVVLIPKIPLITLMISSQVINGIILPVILIAMIKLVSNRKLMGKHAYPQWYLSILWVVSAIIIALTLVLVVTSLMGKV
ncbi:MAG: Nramp family divalent metal transporter [Nanoarchaeota archaeon]